MPKILFTTDFDADLSIIENSFGQLKQIFGEDYFNKLFIKYYPECKSSEKKDIIEYFQNNRDKILRKIKISGSKVEREWDKINDNYFLQIENITGFKWKRKIYKCFFSSSYITGGAYEKPNLLFVFPLRTDVSPKVTITHELFHLHFFDIVDKLNIKLNRKNLWDFSEVVVDMVLSELKINNFNYKHMIYPKHKKLYKKIKPVWKSRNNFMEFMINSSEYFKLHG